MDYTFRYYNNDGRGTGRLCSYFRPCPKWYDKCSPIESEEMKDLTENWARFCNAYKVKKVFNECLIHRVIGCRSYALADQFPNDGSLADHPITIMTEDGKYLYIGSNYTGNHEMEQRYTRDSVKLGEYNGFVYELKRTILPPEYSFYCVREHDKCLTFVWECVSTPIIKKSEKVSENDGVC